MSCSNAGSDGPRGRSLDVRGLICPLPVLMVAREIGRLARGERLELVGDDPGIVEDLPVWCRKSGHLLVELEESEGSIRAIVERA